MNLSVYFRSLFVVLLFSACSQRFVSPGGQADNNLLPFPAEYPPLELTAEYLSAPVEFFTPPVIVSTDFSPEERYFVKARTEKLFEKREELLINFGEIAGSDFCFPLPGARTLSHFGPRRGRKHTGIDIKTFANDTIRSAFDGIVRISGKAQGYGNVIVIRHYNGLETVYGHNSRHLVKAGEKVKAGQPISLEGRTGRASTDHLHFETRINGQPFDPRMIIDFDAQLLLNRSLVFTPDENGRIRINQV